MGNRLGIHNGFPREDLVRQSDNKPSNNISTVNLNDTGKDMLDLSTSNSSKNVKFTGLDKVSNGFARGMEKLELGGFMAEFLVLDFLGMMVPRTYQAFMRNSEELGHLNYKAGAEEAIREMLTGPSMTLLPIAGLAAAKSIYKDASLINLDTQDKFKDTMMKVSEKVENKTHENLKKSFYNEIFEEITIPHKATGKEIDPKTGKNFVNHLLEIEKAQNELNGLNKNFGKKWGYTLHKIVAKPVEFVNRTIKGDPFYEYKKLTESPQYKLNQTIAEEKQGLTKLISDLNKTIGISPEDSHRVKILKPNAGNPDCLDLGKEKFTALAKDVAGKDAEEVLKQKAFKNNNLHMPKSASELAGDLINYSKGVINDLPQNATKEEFKNSLDKLHSRAKGGRKVIIAATIAVIATVLYAIPELYKRNEQFPGIDGLVDEKTPAHSTGLAEQGGR